MFKAGDEIKYIGDISSTRLAKNMKGVIREAHYYKGYNKYVIDFENDQCWHVPEKDIVLYNNLKIINPIGRRNV